jgi:hypothetical protein
MINRGSERESASEYLTAHIVKEVFGEYNFERLSISTSGIG